MKIWQEAVVKQKQFSFCKEQQNESLKYLQSNDIITLLAVFEPDGPMWKKMVDPEAEVREEDEDVLDDDENPSKENVSYRVEPNEVILDDGQRIVVSHPRRKNHNRAKKSPPTTPAKSGNETSACLERKM